MLGSCQVEKASSKGKSTKLALGEPVVADVTPLHDCPTMLQIAQSLPILDFPWEDFQGPDFVETSEDEFKLAGDGAQPSARIQLLCAEKPIRIVLEYGPIFDGFGFRMPLEHFTFERVDGGWKRTSFEVTYHGTLKSDGTRKPPLSERENRKKIEQLTGKPYGYHWGRTSKF